MKASKTSKVILAVFILIFSFSISAASTWSVQQASNEWEVEPYSNSQSGSSWYLGTVSGNSNFVITPYRDTANGRDNLIFGSEANSDMDAQLDLMDVPSGSSVTVADDSDGAGNYRHSRDELSLSHEPEGDWGWSSCCTDGGVLEMPSSWNMIRIDPSTSVGVGPNLQLDAKDKNIDLNEADVITIEPEFNDPPDADFDFSPSNPGEGESINFDASSSNDPDGSIQTYEWDWDDDGTFETSTTDPETTHSYSSSGEFTVTLRVTDNDGETDSHSETVSIEGVPKISNFQFFNNSGHGFDVQFEATDSDGEDNMTECGANVSGADSNEETYTGTITDDSNGDNEITCRVDSITHTDNSDWNHTENVDVNAWAEDSTGNEGTATEPYSFPNHEPVVTQVNYADYSSIHAFNLSAQLYDPDSDDSSEINSSCKITLSDGDVSPITIERSVDYSFGNNSEGACRYSNVNSSMPYPSGIPRGSGFEVLEDISVEVEVEDVHGAKSTDTSSNTIPNDPPYAYTPTPSDGGTVSDFPVDVSFFVDDSEDDDINITVYNGSGGVLYEEDSLTSSDQFGFEWDVPNAVETQYEWIVEAEDYWERGNTSFTFTKIIGDTYRSDLRVNLNYSSMVINVDNNRFTELTIENNVNNEKDLTVNLTGVNSEFLDGSTQKNFEMAGQSTRKYTIRVNPNQTTDKDLVIDVINNDIGITTTKTIPVTVLSNSQESNEVPGIGLIQLIFLAAAATVLYSVRL